MDRETTNTKNGQLDSLDLQELNNSDPLKRIVEKENNREEFSPMDPPDAYAPPQNDQIGYEDMHPLIQQFMDEHKLSLEKIDAFENALHTIYKDGMSAAMNEALGVFYAYLDNQLVSHNLREEKFLFPVLQQCLLEKGLHSNGPEATSSVDMLEDDHIKLMQLAAVTFNFFGLAARLPDPASRAIVLDAALEQGKALVEMLRLHIFREDNVVFGQAQQYIPKDRLDDMLKLREALENK